MTVRSVPELLVGVREKVVRAATHLDDFQKEVAEYVGFDPYGVVTSFEWHIREKSQRAGTTARARVDPPPPLILSSIAGDFLHNLRASLDHLARALVLVNGGSPRDGVRGATQFPILLVRRRDQRPADIHAIEGGISSAAQELLDAIQPYDQPSHPLWMLNYLSIVDKHRTLILTTVNFGHSVTTWEGTDRTSFATRSDMKDGTMIVWWLQESEGYDPASTPNIEFDPQLTFADSEQFPNKRVPAVTLLTDLFVQTRDRVVQPFARSFFGGELDFQ